MRCYTVSFFGHRVIQQPLSLERKLEELIRKLIFEKEYVVFLVGRDGDFDQLVSSTIRRCKRELRNDNSSLVLVLPYVTSEYRYNQDSFQDYYDEIEVCAACETVHYKSAHQTRNRAMVQRSDLTVFYVERCCGGAYQTMKYADCIGSNYCNLRTT